MARQPAHPSAQRAAERGTRVEQLRLVLKTVPPTVRLLWSAAPVALLAVVGVTLGQALVPAAIAWVAKLIVDGVVLAQAGDVAARDRVVSAVMLELGGKISSGPMLGILVFSISCFGIGWILERYSAS